MARNLDRLAAQADRKNPRWRRLLKADRTSQALIADLVAARATAAMTREDIDVRMRTTKRVISRLESGVGTRPTLRTIERYAEAVGALLEIPVRTRR